MSTTQLGYKLIKLGGKKALEFAKRIKAKPTPKPKVKAKSKPVKGSGVKPRKGKLQKQLEAKERLQKIKRVGKIIAKPSKNILSKLRKAKPSRRKR